MFLPAWPGASPAFLGRPSGLGGPRGCPPTGRTGSGRLGAACLGSAQPYARKSRVRADLKIIAFTANRLRVGRKNINPDTGCARHALRMTALTV